MTFALKLNQLYLSNDLELLVKELKEIVWHPMNKLVLLITLREFNYSPYILVTIIITLAHILTQNDLMELSIHHLKHQSEYNETYSEVLQAYLEKSSFQSVLPKLITKYTNN
jgi:hypothetical protein